jgi:hypothetical protein
MPLTLDGNGIITGASTLATTVASPTLTTPNINSAQFATVLGTAPIYPCRAWVNFNGTGTVAIRASGNVSSITDNGTGDYTVNFTTAMPDANYAMSGSGSGGTSSLLCVVAADATTARTTSAIRLVTTFANGSSAADVAVVSVSIFR